MCPLPVILSSFHSPWYLQSGRGQPAWVPPAAAPCAIAPARDTRAASSASTHPRASCGAHAERKRYAWRGAYLLPSPQVLVWKPFLTWLGGMSGTGTMARVGGIAAPGASPCAAPGAAIPCTHPRGLSPRRGPATTPGPAPRQTLPPCGPCSPLVAFSLAQQGCAGPPARGGGRQRRRSACSSSTLRPLLFFREIREIRGRSHGACVPRRRPTPF